MRNVLFRKGLVLGIIVLFVGASTIPAIGEMLISQENKTSFNNFNSSANTLYVGGDGPGNYTSIQDAIDNATDGDTVFVYKGLYFEHIVVDKSISLLFKARLRFL